MTGASDLNRRLTLEAPTESDDGAGGVTRDYAAVAVVWAHVAPQAAHADVTAASLCARLRWRIVIRRREDITTRHRFREGERIYQIVAARQTADRRFTEIEAEERQD